ncbi:MAG: 4-hydroxy-3-methylbut-2-en-1-yl diphosphate synthase [Candidatus Marinimicrobia bacterium]|nr:4-hydroxy-3-methylbut-2-en-1-yl diphosphate synthase [Candidatus Neomarinimicrobiota bacterium]
MIYCNSLFKYERRKTNDVQIGDVSLGSNFPIRLQSMTTTDTMDTLGTVNQSIKMIDAGSDYVRITAPSIKEAKNLSNIKEELVKKGYNTPLIADIHFTPNAAEIAARIVEKVRINPGNYADTKKFNFISYSDQEYENEIERISKRFKPLIHICKEYGTAMRIGTNHGSLSDRIMSRYGDTPLGMVESALEFLRICKNENFHNIVLSMKSSNPIVMVEAYRLLVNRMNLENMHYPLHLGVTEAGEGEDGRIKSSVGIGTLLEDGIGDTVRVSLTEEPEFEIPVAKSLVNRYLQRTEHKKIKKIPINPINPFEYKPRDTYKLLNIGSENVPRVILDLSDENEKELFNSIQQIGYKYVEKNDKWEISEMGADFIYLGNNKINFKIPGTLGVIQNINMWDKNNKFSFPLITKKDIKKNDLELSDKLNFLEIYADESINKIIEFIKNHPSLVLILKTNNSHGLAEQRSFIMNIINNNLKIPIIISRSYSNLSVSDFQIYASTDLGGLLVDGMGNGIFISTVNCGQLINVNKSSFGILQATRTRITKTEFISCPSCGRTLFDLQEVTARIRLKTQHLKGLKIGIMGCIVNGPGEMADADYGYVGTGIGKISLYKKQDVVNRDVPMDEADQALINIIKENGDWIDP